VPNGLGTAGPASASIDVESACRVPRRLLVERRDLFAKGAGLTQAFGYANA